MKPALGVALLASLLACGNTGPLRVRAQADEAADFSRYRSFAQAPPPAAADLPGYSESVGQALEARIAEHLVERGLAPASWEEADLQVAMSVGGRTRTEVWHFEQSVVASASGSQRILKGSLRIDVVDRAAERVVWQGVASQETMGDSLDQEAGLRAVDRLMARFPSGSSAR